MRFEIRTVAVVALITLMAAACGEDSPTDGGGGGSIEGFEIRRSGSVLVEWTGAVEAGDTIRLSAGDSIPVEFRWQDGSGAQVSLPAGAELSVTSSSPGVARWAPHASNESAGAFVTVGLLQPVTTSVRVQLEVDGETEISTSQIPVKVSP